MFFYAKFVYKHEFTIIQYQLKMTFQKKNTIDITDDKSEYIRLENEFLQLYYRFIALAMDYDQYVKSDIFDNKIYSLRDDVIYRLYSAKFHLELLFKHINDAEKNIQKNDTNRMATQIPIIAYMPVYTQQITSLFESFIYHSVSIFDYVSTLANYISGKKKENTLMWTQLVRSVRDKGNIFSKTKFSTIIDDIDREFVGKLYDYRALLIHRKADVGAYSITHSYGFEEKVTTVFYAGKRVISTFKKLQEANKQSNFTLKYVAVWILNEVNNNITDILFSMKEEIISKASTIDPLLFYYDTETKEKLPISNYYWNEQLYKKK